MADNNIHESVPASVFLPPFPRKGRPTKRRRQNTPSDTQSDRYPFIDWSSSPSRPLRQQQGTSQPRESGDTSCQVLTPATRTQDDARPGMRLFQPSLIRAEVAKATESFPLERDQGAYTAKHPLIHWVRNLIRARGGRVRCTLCAFYEWGPIVETHKLKRCSHRTEAEEVQPWLEMFRHYQARGGGPGARCSHCRFPTLLCWRTVYREEMDLKYGNEKEAQEEHDVWYREAQCAWVKTMQRFVTACMVVHGRVTGTGVSRLGGTVLEMMGWQDWSGLEEKGPEHIRMWLEEMDEIRGLRCPRLLKLFWFLAEGAHSRQSDDD